MRKTRLLISLAFALSLSLCSCTDLLNFLEEAEETENGESTEIDYPNDPDLIENWEMEERDFNYWFPFSDIFIEYGYGAYINFQKNEKNGINFNRI